MGLLFRSFKSIKTQIRCSLELFLLFRTLSGPNTSVSSWFCSDANPTPNSWRHPNLKKQNHVNARSQVTAVCPADGDACESMPCAHGGVCKDTVGGFTCFCQPGFQGSNCEIGTEPRRPSADPDRSMKLQDSGGRRPSHAVSLVSAVVPELCENRNGGCAHFCAVVEGNIQCSCASGYFLEWDDKSCNSHGEKDSTWFS